MASNKGIIVFVAAVVLIVGAIAIESALKSDSGNDDKTQTVDHNGSVETSVSVQHADSAHDVILTTHKVWLHASEYSTVVHRDTIPALDSLNTEGEDAVGDTHSVRVKKDYQIFITVK